MKLNVSGQSKEKKLVGSKDKTGRSKGMKLDGQISGGKARKNKFIEKSCLKNKMI